MKTIFDELKQEVKNWWVSLILGILYVAVALGLMFFPFNGYAAVSIQHLDAGQRFAGNCLCSKQPPKGIQLGLVSGRRSH